MVAELAVVAVVAVVVVVDQMEILTRILEVQEPKDKVLTVELADMCQDNMKVAEAEAEPEHLAQILIKVPVVLAVLVNQTLSLDQQSLEPAVVAAEATLEILAALVAVELVVVQEQQQQEQLTLEAEVGV
jgi:hypothetical protein